MIDWIAQQCWTWWVNELGILLEIAGALLILVAAFRSRAAIKDIPDSWDAELSVKLRDIIAAQAYTGLTGFGLLALGLLGQMVGGIGC